jgi:hypothetical protein
MLPEPTPTQIKQIYDPELIPEQRRLDCRKYNECLTTAYKARWEGFSCSSCQAHEPRTSDELRADFEGMARLISEIPRGGRLMVWEESEAEGEPELEQESELVPASGSKPEPEPS